MVIRKILICGLLSILGVFVYFAFQPSSKPLAAIRPEPEATSSGKLSADIQKEPSATPASGPASAVQPPGHRAPAPRVVRQPPASGWPRSPYSQDLELLPGAVLVEERREPQSDGTVTSRRILHVAGKKYPFVRVESQFDARGAEIRREEMVADHVLASLQPGWDVARLEVLLEPFGASIRNESPFGGPILIQTSEVSLEALPKLLEQLEGISSAVDVAEPDYLVRLGKVPDDARYGQLYGMTKISAPTAWDTRTDASAVVVAVVDTGIRYTHEDLKDNLWKNPGESGLDGSGRDKATNRVDDDNNGVVDDVYGYDAVNQDGDPLDDDGHGTHCAGTIAGTGNNRFGVAGVAWRAQIMGCKFLDATGSGYTSDAIIVLNYARAQGAQITSNSWGGGGYSRLLETCIRELNTRGTAFVAAAGNSGSDNDRLPTYPANYEVPNVISVAATDANDGLADFSCIGARTVDLGAPGVDILSSTYDGDSTYGELSGTSMATPHVAGAMTLLRAQYPSKSLAELIAAVIGNTDALPALAGKCVSGGRLNVAKAMAALASGGGGGGGGTDPSLPLNNSLAAAWSLSASRFTSTVDGSRIGSSGQSFWWRWTAPATGRLQIHTRKSSPAADTVLVAYSASGNSIRQMLSNDNATGGVRWSALDFGVTKGSKMVFEVRGMGAGQTLVLEGIQGVQAGPSNDNFASPAVASGSRWQYRGSNYNASAETGEPAHAGLTANTSVWLSWIAPSTRSVTISTAGSSTDTVLAVYTGSTLDALTPVVSNDNAFRGLRTSQVRLDATAGTTYRIAVDTKNNMAGPYLIQLR